MNCFPKVVAMCLLAGICSADLLAQTREELRDALKNAPRNLPWTPSTRSAFNSGSEKIDPGLLAIADSVSSKGLDTLETVAKLVGVPTSHGMVEVSLIAENEKRVASLRKKISQLRGRVLTTYKTHVFAFMPPGQIPSLSKLKGLYFAASPNIAYADQDLSNGSFDESISKIKADRLQKAGFRGQGIKVGILDFGFQGYQALQAAGKLPAPAMSKTFNESGHLENGQVHGAACAEIIHTMAPDAQLFLAGMGEGDGTAPEDQIILGARWLKSQGVDIISFSGGGHYGPHNGKGVLDLLVEEITADHKVLWVNAAGNEAGRHFRTDFPGVSADGWIPIGQYEAIAVAPAPDGAISLLVNWDDWGDDALHPSATQDIDAVLFAFDKTTGKATFIADSHTAQNGRTPPVERIFGKGEAGVVYLLELHATQVKRPVRIHVYSNAAGGLIEPLDPTGSIAIPATSPAALTVGAINIENGELESYSSRGPTDDNRAKPDLSSYDRVSSLSYGHRFTGTSAACPNVAGLAALLKSAHPEDDATALRRQLMLNLRHQASDDPGFGAGITEVKSTPSITKAEKSKVSKLQPSSPTLKPVAAPPEERNQ